MPLAISASSFIFRFRCPSLYKDTVFATITEILLSQRWKCRSVKRHSLDDRRSCHCFRSTAAQIRFWETSPSTTEEEEVPSTGGFPGTCGSVLCPALVEIYCNPCKKGSTALISSFHISKKPRHAFSFTIFCSRRFKTSFLFSWTSQKCNQCIHSFRSYTQIDLPLTQFS